MKIGVCIGIDDLADFEKQIAEFPKEGFTTCQLLAWNPKIRTPENAEKIKKLLLGGVGRSRRMGFL